MKSALGSFLCLMSLAACSASPRPQPPPAPSASAAALPSPPPVSSADLGEPERCQRGDLVVCEQIALAKARTIRADEQESGMRELRALCDRGLADACARWGELSRVRDRAGSLAAYERGCSLGSPRACAYLGIALDNQSPGMARSQELLKRSCDEGSPDGCTALAETMRPKQWGEAEVGAFWALVTRGCLGKVARACRLVGVREQDGNGIPRDTVSAASHLQIACEGRDGEGCFHWGFALEMGLGTVKDEKAAARAYSIACDEGDMSGCDRLGHAYARGVGVAKDTVHALTLFRDACRAGDHDACVSLVSDEQLEPDRDKRLAQLSSLCSERAMVGCQVLGEALSWEPKDLPVALSKLDEACTAGVNGACRSGYFAATRELRRKKKKGLVPQALGFLERACDLKSPDRICVELAEQLSTGEFVARDPKRGAELSVSLCEGHPELGACKLAGDAWLSGTGRPADPPRAVAAYTTACNRRDAKACLALSTLTRAGKGTEKNPSLADELKRKAASLDDDD